MEQITQFIARVGIRNIAIVGVIIILLIVAILIYRSLRLKVYRQTIVELENKINGIKTLPIQYRLGRVKSIAKNMAGVAKEYEEFVKDYDSLQEFQKNELGVLVDDVDEQLFYGKLSGANKKLNELTIMANKYETDSKELLARIEKVTEIENEQRIEIIRVKEKYRSVQSQYDSIRGKVENYVPEVGEIFKSIDEDFVKLETMMNNQLFSDAKEFTGEIEARIDRLSNNMKELPSYVSVVTHLLPKKIKDFELVMKELEEDTYALEAMNAIERHDEIVNQLEEARELVKAVKIKKAGENLETLTDKIESLVIDLNAERESYKAFKKNWEEAIKVYEETHDRYEQCMKDYQQLGSYYVINTDEVTIEENNRQFTILYDSYKELEDEILSGDFAYNDALEKIYSLLERIPEHIDCIEKFVSQRDVFYKTESKAIEELENINIVLLETKSEIKNHHLPMINDSYKDYIKDSYKKAEEIQEFRNQRPVQLEILTSKVEGARDVIYKLYDNVHNLIVTAQMVEEAIVFGNRFRSTFLEVNTELTKSEVLFRNGEYTEALTTAIDVIEKIQPGSYEKLIKKQEAQSV